MRQSAKKKPTQLPKTPAFSKRKKKAAEVIAFKKERRPFAEFSEEVREFLIDNDYSE